MGLLKKYLLEAIGQMERDRVKMEFSGTCPRCLRSSGTCASAPGEISTHYEGCQVNICLNYGGRDELLRAARALCPGVFGGEGGPQPSE